MAAPEQAARAALQELPDAAERLRYVKQLTEAASHKVFALVEQAQGLASKLEQQADPAAREAGLAMQAWASELLLSQDFQDLSGQVVNKVLGLFGQLESALPPLLPASAETVATPTDELAGVQTPDKALKQDDVDDLLASLGF